jgi:hypothetical protein
MYFAVISKIIDHNDLFHKKRDLNYLLKIFDGQNFDFNLEKT